MTTPRRFAPLIRDLFASREWSLSLLLSLQLLAIFIVAPLIDGGHGQYRWLLDLCLALMALTSAFIISHNIKRRVVILIFSLCVGGFSLGPLLADPNASQAVLALSELLFSVSVSLIVAAKVFVNGPTTLHHIRGAMVIYLNIAILFSVLDGWLAVSIPGAYANLPTNHIETPGAMIYFSLATLTTAGYGDIVPIHPFARSLATLESVMGQFYMAVFIGTLIGQHVAHRQRKNEGAERVSRDS